MYLDHEPEITVKLDSPAGWHFCQLGFSGKTKLTSQSFFDPHVTRGTSSTGLPHWDGEDRVETGEKRLLNILLADKLNQELVIKIQQQYNLVRRAGRRAVCLDKFPSEKPTHDVFFETEEGTNKIIKIKDWLVLLVISRSILMMFDGKFWRLGLSF